METSVPRVFLSGVAIVGITWATGAYGLSVGQFLAGVLGGGVVTAVFLVARRRD